MRKTRTKTRTPEQQVTRMAKRLLPRAQADRGGFTLVDVTNHSDADQRHMMRSQEKKTLRRKTKLDQLKSSGVLDPLSHQACEWYHDAYTMGFETLGITADYGSSGGGGDGVVTHLAKYKAQAEARVDYEFARAGISPILLPLLDKVVLHGRPMGKLGLSFRRAVRQLVTQVERLLPNT